MVTDASRVAAAVLAATVIACGAGLPVRRACAEESFLDDARVLAKSHFEAGVAFQSQRSYERAIIEYQAAYAITPMPELLYDIGQCYRLGGQPRTAVLYYRRYLELVSEGGASDEARAHVTALRQEIAAHPTVAGVAIGAPGAPDPADADEARAWRWIGAGSMIAGLAVGGLGFELAREGQTDGPELLGYAGVGAALVAAGGVTWWLATRTHAPRRIVAAPVAGPGVAGVTLAGEF